jgi:iron complex outermembrane receptor protein
MDADSSRSFFGSVGYKDLTLEGAFISREKVNPTAQFFSTFNDPSLRTVDERSYASLKYAHSFEDVVDVTAQLYYDRNDFDIGYPVDPSLFREIQVGEWWGTELQLNKKILGKHVLTVGFEYRDDFRQSDKIFDDNSGQVFTDISRNRESHGVYVQGDFVILTNLHFNAGARYDQYGNFDPAFNPRLGLIYHPTPTATLKALYGTAFRAPNFLELSDPRFQDIQPEEITSYELVYEQQIGGNLRSSISGFYNEMDDLIVLENGSFTNFDANALGTELALTGQWTNGIRTRLSYTLQKAEDRSRNEDLPDSPQHLIKANVSVPLYRQKIFASVEWQYTTSRHTLRTTTMGETLPGQDASGYGVMNVTLFSQNLVKDLEFSASIYNLFDRHFSDPASRFHQQSLIEQDGRTFRMKLTYRF